MHFSWLGPELSSVAWSTGAQLIIFFCFRFSGHSIISGLESWSGVLEWSGVKIGVDFGVDFGADLE